MAVRKTVHAVGFLFKAPLIVLFLFAVNWMTYSGEWWFKWAVLGIGIAWVISLFRVLRAVILAGGLAALAGYVASRR
jgi:Sec-independent protein secretion pathway component TatC